MGRNAGSWISIRAASPRLAHVGVARKASSNEVVTFLFDIQIFGLCFRGFILLICCLVEMGRMRKAFVKESSLLLLT